MLHNVQPRSKRIKSIHMINLVENYRRDILYKTCKAFEFADMQLALDRCENFEEEIYVAWLHGRNDSQKVELN